MSKGWDDRAEQWLAWARTPNFDGYWAYREAFFDRVAPAPGRATLEVGCGEGRVARDLAARGHRVTAIDASAILIAHALEADPDGRYPPQLKTYPSRLTRSTWSSPTTR